MIAVYLCLVSVILSPFVSSKISLISFGGKTYLNGQYIVEAPDNGNIADGIVNGLTKGLKLVIVKTLTLQERITLGERLKKSNDELSEMEEKKLKRLEDRENDLEKLFKGEEEQRPNYLTNENKVSTISRKKFIVKEMPEPNNITEVDSRTTQ
ncbi:uncharacterized protein LOC100573202 [Acyrthosiphon pisum]|uniref:Uncharacterized protein n=1 Tax=Acyrthosiphon pisum TaxID=7029 RepID=A0A8R2B3W1_ACYPI|nr:uncharacterized protein LOC100573202 [Acyrthosiphon pisum]XP_008179244.1 uncharacterized protein LOC100573202 [Acyrthosiphon pisum]|eukprot:XP_003241900.1 PREDICTED: uncharacterized protein LOC100573202 [Acyrthosiphon pisum]